MIHPVLKALCESVSVLDVNAIIIYSLGLFGNGAIAC
jgi:hypothetical protein